MVDFFSLATLTNALNVISQSLLIPVIIFLLIFALYATITLGGLIYEFIHRRRAPNVNIKELIYEISIATDYENIRNTIRGSNLLENHKNILVEIASSSSLAKESRIALARNLIEKEEDRIEKIIGKTDVITRVGPTIGLMGTLIPMGPGLAALGTGDIVVLSEAIIVAFDTTVVGVAAGSIAYIISKVRRIWYDDYSSNLDSLSDTILEKIEEL